jgi:hypothetical protein
MRLLAVLALSIGVTAQQCMNQAFAALSDPYFAWLVKGTASERSSNVTAICASATNPARDGFNKALDDFKTACIPAGDQTSAIALTLNLLNTLLCSTQPNDNAGNDYCLLSLLPLFDSTYFAGLATGGVATPPPLQPVSDDKERFGPLCASTLCNAFIEKEASALLLKLPPGSDPSAANFIRKVTSSNRCACAVKNTPCYGNAVAGGLIGDNGGAKSFIEGKACDSNGILSACARTWVNCENVPLPTCGKPCADGILATVSFRVKNLNYTCVQEKLIDQAIHHIKADVIANLPGLLHTDFDCECSASASPNTGTECKCTVKCLPLATLLNFDLAAIIAKLKKVATALVVPMSRTDDKAPSCQLVQVLASFGSSFELLSVTTNLPSPTPANEGGAASIGVGMSVFALALLVL